MADLHFVVYSDYLCPWCVNADARLRRLEREYAGRVALEFKSFLLRPEPRPEPDGEEEAAAAREKFRAYTRGWEQIAAEADAGELRPWSGDEGPPSHSVPAHLVAKAAARLGAEPFRRMHERLLRAYFVESRDISREPVLRSLWRELSLDAADFEASREPALRDAVLADHAEAVRLGATGVPAVRLADHDAVIVGAQPLAIYRRWIDRALARRGGERVSSLFSLEGRVAVVTGASAGIGVGLAEGLAAAGAQLVLAARREERLEELASRLAAKCGTQCLAVRCDVADESSVDELVAKSLARFGRVDVLVNNAGITEVVPAEDEPLPVFDGVLDVNLRGVFLCSQRFGRGMLERGQGAIVNVASVLGLVGSGQVPQASYAASKGGVINLTRELAAQWARRGVRVNAIAPGWFASEMTAEMFESEQSHKWMRSRTPMGRPGREGELVGALLFLASDASTFVTGQTLAVDGGWTIV